MKTAQLQTISPMTETSTTLPPGIILISHPVLASITEGEMLEALLPPYRMLPRKLIELDDVRHDQHELADLDWGTARRKLAEQYRTLVAPVLSDNPDWRVSYFGTAPIPLAIELGCLLGGWAKVDVYQKHHDTKKWAWPKSGRGERATFVPAKLENGRVEAAGNIVLRIALSHPVSDAREVVKGDLGEIEIALQQPHEDALESVEDLNAFRDEVNRVLDWVANNRPNAELHLFASMTVGASVCLGRCINPTMHPPVRTYQYSRTNSPPYTYALTVHGPEPERPALTHEQQTRASMLRRRMSEELCVIRKFTAELKAISQEAPVTWLSSLPLGGDQPFTGLITRLAPIFRTPIGGSEVDLATTMVAGGFQYESANRIWQVGDDLLSAISDRLPSEGEQRHAMRLFLLHEAIHLASHGLTEATAISVRRFPKIVEEMDYHADVWAFVHEYALRLSASPQNPPDARAYFIDTVKVALGTFWAFDSGNDRERMEVRRINRYLIWYWQLLRLESTCSLDEVLRVLANRPFIELAGPRIQASDDRVFYNFGQHPWAALEIAVLHGNRFRRFANGPGAPVAGILEGFRHASSENIRLALKSISDQIPD
jgi:hypothetical protein